MSEANLVDARGLSCPEPVLLARNAAKEYGKAAFAVLVSSATSRDNVSRWLQNEGHDIRVVENGADWRIEVAAK
jgi:TusA-related sulfurtransferase